MSSHISSTLLNQDFDDLNSTSSSPRFDSLSIKSPDKPSSPKSSSPNPSSSDIFCCLCTNSFLPGMPVFKCENCERTMCKLHSVTIGDTEKSRICDKCNSRRLAGKEYETEGLHEKVKAIKLKIRYFTEEIERRQQEISAKSISNSKISSQIDKSTKQWQNKEKDLKYKLAQERAQNERLDNIAENLKKAVEDSRANVAHIESEFSRYNSEMTLSKFESETIDDENKKLMSEVDKLNISLKARAPIFKLNSMTCPQCFAQIMRIHTKGDNVSVIDLDDKTSRNVSILQRLSVIRENEGDSFKACNKCIIM